MLLLRCRVLFVPSLLVPVDAIALPWLFDRVLEEGIFCWVIRVGEAGDSSSLVGCGSFVDVDSSALAFSTWW